MVSWSISLKGAADKVIKAVESTAAYPDIKSKQLDDAKQLIKSEIMRYKHNADHKDVFVHVEAKGAISEKGTALLLIKVETIDLI